MQIKFTPVTQQFGGLNVRFWSDPDDPTNKMIIIEGIKKPLLLPRGIYCRYIKSVSLEACKKAICISFNLVEMLNLYNEEIEEDLRNQVGLQEVDDADIDYALLGIRG
jgi:hypothetical protein